jgi:hypothetical protein
MRRPLAAAFALALAVGLLATSPAWAQEGEGTALVLRLARQTPWVTAEDPFSVDLVATGADPAAELELVTTLYPAVRTRSAFTQTLEGTGLGRATRSFPAVPLDESAPTNADGQLTLQFALPRIDTPSGPTTLPPLEEGVYPVTFVVRPRGGGTAQATLTTHLVRLPEIDSGVPLDVAWVQPLSAPPAASVPEGDAAAAGTQAALASVVEVLTANPLVPVNLDITPETLAAVAQVDPDTATALGRLVDDRHPVLVAPYVDVDPSAVVNAGRGDDLAIQRATGEALLFETIGTRGDARTWSVEQPLTPAALGHLRALGVTRLVLPETTLAPLTNLRQTLTNPYEVDSGDGITMQGVSADEGLAAHFRDTDDQVLAAHQLLADLAVIYLDAPAAEHGVVVRPPSSWRPSTAFLDAALPALATASILRPVTLDTFLAEVPVLASRGRPTVRALATDTRVGALPAGRLAEGATTVDQLASLVDPASGVAEEARLLLLASESARLTSVARAGVLDQLNGRLNELRGRVRLPAGRTFRLAAREGRIPLTVVNSNDFDVKVDIILSSEKLEFTDEPGGQRSSTLLAGVVIPARGTLTRAIPVKARASATFSLLAVVRAPAGQELDRSRITITSTAFSGVGIVLSIGAALFLAVWWIRHWRSSRRERRPLDGITD